MKNSHYDYNKGSEAYDFDLFLPKRKKNNVVQLPKNLPNGKPRRMVNGNVQNQNYAKVRISSAKAKSIAVISTCAILLTLNLVSRAQYSAVNNEILNAQSVQSELLVNEEALNQKLLSRVSYDNLEHDAQEMGMFKADPSQTEYIVLEEDETQTALDN